MRSAGSNLGPTNQELHRPDRGRGRRACAPSTATRPIPVDLVTTSASGLDPDISPAAAEYQVARVARPAGMTEDEVRAAVARHTEQPLLGFLGQPRVNVLELEPRPRRPAAMTDPERDALDVRPTAEEMLARVRAETAERAGPAARLPGHGARASARRTGCSRRGTGASRAARTSSSGSSRPTAGRTPPSCSTASRSCRAGGSSTAASSSRRWTPTRSSPAQPTVALVDELAHTNVPGSARAKRWQDVEVIRDAGIHVVSTLNVQHLEWVADAVATITGAPVNERLPDEVLPAPTRSSSST